MRVIEKIEYENLCLPTEHVAENVFLAVDTCAHSHSDAGTGSHTLSLFDPKNQRQEGMYASESHKEKEAERERERALVIQ